MADVCHRPRLPPKLGHMKYFVSAILLAIAVCGFVLLRAPSEPGAPAVATASPPPRIEEQLRDAILTAPPTEGTSTPKTDETHPLAPKLQLLRGQLPWEEKIDSVLLTDDLTNSGKARQLLSMLAALPEPALARAAEEAVTRLPDSDYNAVALPFLANPQTHGAVEAVLFADLMEREDAIALPALLRIARIPQHPYAKVARDNLNLLLKQDFGEDWLKWEAAVRTNLAEPH